MKKTRRLVMLALALVLTFAMATTTTFAWFTMNETVTVQGISGKATTDTEGLLISATTGGPWTGTVDFGGAVVDLAALTMGKSVTDGALVPSVKGDVLGTGAKFFDKAGSDSSTDASKYLTKKIFFNANTAMAITLTNISLKATGAGRLIKTPDGFDADTFGANTAITANTAVTTSIINALRLAVFNADGELVAVYAFFDGVATNVGWDTAATGGDYDGLNLAGALYNQIMGADPAVSGAGFATETLNTGVVDADGYVNATPTTDKVVGNLAGLDVETSCTIVIWVEGLDGHCINNIIEQQVDIILEFTGGA